MAVDEAQQFCTHCQRYVLARRPGTNHVFHLLMCVFTCGLWVIIWFLSAAKVGGWRCSICGGTQFGYAQTAGAAAKSAVPRALMLLGVGLGGFFALVIGIGMCSAARQRQKAGDVAVAESEARMRENAAAAALPAWQAAPDVVALGAIRSGQVKPTGTDRTGTKLEVQNHNVPGWKLSTFAFYKASPSAWKLSVEGGTGELCKPEHWAPAAQSLEVEGMLPLHATWYRLSGGPLDGLIVKGFVNTPECMFHFATVEYAKLQGWEHSN